MTITPSVASGSNAPVIMGTSVRMIELHYGSLLDGAGAAIASALDALDAQRDRATAERSEDVWPLVGQGAAWRKARSAGLSCEWS